MTVSHETERTAFVEKFVRSLKVPNHPIAGTNTVCPGSGMPPMIVYLEDEAQKGPCSDFHCQTIFTLVETYGGRNDGHIEWLNISD